MPDLVLPGHPRGQIVDPRPPALASVNGNPCSTAASATWRRCWPAIEADGADFLDGNPKMLLPDLYYLGDRGGSAVYGFFAGPRFFLVDAPGGPGPRRVRRTSGSASSAASR